MITIISTWDRILRDFVLTFPRSPSSVKLLKLFLPWLVEDTIGVSRWYISKSAIPTSLSWRLQWSSHSEPTKKKWWYWPTGKYYLILIFLYHLQTFYFSMGTNVFTYFLNWVERPVELGGGGGGSDWVANHIHAYLNIGGPLLGVPKAAAALVSGEMRDTAQFGALNAYLIDNFFSKSQRGAMFRYTTITTCLPPPRRVFLPRSLKTQQRRETQQWATHQHSRDGHPKSSRRPSEASKGRFPMT